MNSIDKPKATHIAADLARYLQYLLPDDTHRSAMLRLLEELDPAAAEELVTYLRRLNASNMANPEFQQTYLFVSAWPTGLLRSIAKAWSDPALRHLVATANDDAAVATLFCREFGGLSEMWVASIPKGVKVTLNSMGSTLAIAAVGDSKLTLGGDSLRSDSPMIVSPRSTIMLEPGAGDKSSSLALVVATPTSRDEASEAWSFTATPAKPRPKYPPGRRLSSDDRRHGHHPSPGGPSPTTPKSTGQSPPR